MKKESTFASTATDKLSACRLKLQKTELIFDYWCMTLGDHENLSSKNQ